jgi:hypothetical protein
VNVVGGALALAVPSFVGDVALRMEREAEPPSPVN